MTDEKHPKQELADRKPPIEVGEQELRSISANIGNRIDRTKCQLLVLVLDELRLLNKSYDELSKKMEDLCHPKAQVEAKIPEITVEIPKPEKPKKKKSSSKRY